MQSTHADKSTQAIDTVGKLMRLHYKTGDPCVQLVFKTSQGTFLSLSRDAAMVKSLIVGKSYRVRGEKRFMGDKIYIVNPLVSPRHIAELPKKAGLAVGLACFVVVGTFLTANALQSRPADSTSSEQQDTTATSSHDEPEQSAQQPAVAAPAANAATANTTAGTTPTTKKATTTTNKTTQQTSPAPAPSGSATPVPTETLPEPLPTVPQTPTEQVPGPEEPVDPGTTPVDPPVNP